MRRPRIRKGFATIALGAGLVLGGGTAAGAVAVPAAAGAVAVPAGDDWIGSHTAGDEWIG
jgi:hypothetical protein